MNDQVRRLEAVLHEEIPLTQALGVRVADYDGNALTLKAPIEPNINHKATVFGGSLYSVAVLSGWGLLYLRLLEAGHQAHIVIHESQMRYLMPVSRDFESVCSAPEPGDWRRFLRHFERRGKARIALQSEIWLDSNLAVVFEGRYVVHR